MPLDIAIGIFSSIFISQIFSLQLTPWLTILGILFSLSPDLDMIVYLLNRGNSVNAHHHRDLLHFPIIFIIIAGIIYLMISQPLGILFLLSTLLHLIHDSIGVGFGVQWLWPFDRHNYAFFYLCDPAHKGIPRKIFYKWDQAGVDEAIKRYGDEDWVKDIYFKLHPYALAEYFTLIVAVIVLVLYLRF